MARHGTVIAGLVMLVLAVGSPPASAQLTGDGTLHRVGVQYWFATGSGPNSLGLTTSWSSALFRLQYSAEFSTRPLGFQAQYTGGGGMGESFWSLALAYRPSMLAKAMPQFGPVSLRGIVGYSSFRWNIPGGGVATSAGFGIGFDAAVLFGAPAGGGRIALLADYMTFPSTTVTSPTTSGTGTGSVWSVAIHYKLPAKVAGPMPGTAYVSAGPPLDLLGSEWDLNAGYLDQSLTGLSTYRWTGFFVGVGKTF